MNSVYSPHATDEIEALKSSMFKLAGDLNSSSLTPESFETLRDAFVELLFALQKIQGYTNYQYQFESLLTFSSIIRDVQTCAELAPLIVAQVAAMLSANCVALIMRDTESGENIVTYTHGSGPFTPKQRLAPGTGLIGQVIASGKPYCSAEVSPGDNTTAVHAAIGAPLITQGQTIGLLWISRGVEFSEGEIRLTRLLSELTANALHHTDAVTNLLERNVQLAIARAQVRELDDLKAKFINDMSHELRTPITGLNMVLYLLERNGQEKFAQYLDNMREDVERLTNFSESILDITRLESRLSEAQLEPIDFNILVSQLADIYHTRADRANVAWSFAGANKSLMISGDQNLLLTAVGNLMTNAVTYSLQGKVSVQLRYDERRQCATLIVENNGIGLDTGELPHLFERFYRGNRVAESSIAGTGLGLAIVKEIVDFHHGLVEAETTSDGKMRFTMRLPLTS